MTRIMMLCPLLWYYYVLSFPLLLLLIQRLVCCFAYDLRIGSRPSALAVKQAEAVAQALQMSDCRCTTATTNTSSRDNEPQQQQLNPILVQISASGDYNAVAKRKTENVPLAIQNVDFTGALDEALFNGEIDVAVHSLKDIPPDHRWRHHESFQIMYPLPREDPCDVLIGPYQTLDAIPSGTKIGTSSIRRQAQLFAINSSNNKNDIQVINVRGNVETRLEALRMGTVDALILAKAGLKRMNYLVDQECCCFDISPNQMLPGLGQGIVAAVVCCASHEHNNTKNMIWKENLDAAIAASAERAFLNTVDKLSHPWAGRPPLAGLMQRVTIDEVDDDDDKKRSSKRWVFHGLLAKPDGSQVLRASSGPMDVFTKEQAANIGTAVGMDILHQAGSTFFDGSLK